MIKAKVTRIIVPQGNINKIAKHFGVSRECVSRALKFITQGDRPDNIRKEALTNYGGSVARIEYEAKL